VTRGNPFNKGGGGVPFFAFVGEYFVMFLYKLIQFTCNYKSAVKLCVIEIV